VARLLLEAGADVNAVAEDGDSALRQASSRGYPNVARLLVDAGADVSLRNKDGLMAEELAKLQPANLRLNLMRIRQHRRSQVERILRPSRSAFRAPQVRSSCVITARWEMVVYYPPRNV